MIRLNARRSRRTTKGKGTSSKWPHRCTLTATHRVNKDPKISDRANRRVLWSQQRMDNLRCRAIVCSTVSGIRIVLYRCNTCYFCYSTRYVKSVLTSSLFVTSYAYSGLSGMPSASSFRPFTYESQTRSCTPLRSFSLGSETSSCISPLHDATASLSSPLAPPRPSSANSPEPPAGVHRHFASMLKHLQNLDPQLSDSKRQLRPTWPKDGFAVLTV